MAHIFKGTRSNILDRMARDKDHRRAMLFSTYAKTDNGYWLAWKPNADGRITTATYLRPEHPKGEPANEIETWGEGMTVAELVDYFESGEIESDPPGVLNMFIEDEATGEWS